MIRRAHLSSRGAPQARRWARAWPAILAAIGAVALSCQAGNVWSAVRPAPQSTGQNSSDAAKAKVQAVTVQGTTSVGELERQVDRFVTAEIFQLPGEPIMRWETPICPFVQGLPARFNDFLQDRIARIASSAHAPVAGKQCEPNLYVFATSDPENLLVTLLQQNPRMYSSRNGMGRAESFVHSRRPVRVWYNTAFHCRDTQASLALTSKGPGTGSRIDDMSSNICSDADTRLSYAAVNSIALVYIVVDLNRVKEVTTSQLADYVAVIGLANVRLDADAGTAPTILRLFQGTQQPLQGLSAWDRALLYSLYNTDPSSAAQVTDMKDVVMQQVTRTQGPGGALPAAAESTIPAWANEIVPQRAATAPYWYRVGAEQGNAGAQYDLGVMNLQGEGGPKNYTAAVQWFRKAAEQGHVDAQYNLGVMYMLGQGVSQDYAQAAQWFRKAAEQGNVNAQGRLASAYASGQGVPLDYVQAAQWYQKAAEQGDVAAQVGLASLYVNGQGVPRDYAKAVDWYRAAADQGNTAGQYDLAVMYLLGRGVAKDYSNASQWFRKAAEGGDVNAQRNLGLAYVKGRGVPRDYSQAAIWFRKAAEQGDADAQFYLGNMFDSGLGVQRDYVEAYKWWMLAKADSSSSDDAYGRSIFKMKAAASRLSTDQIARAQQEASEWLAAHRASTERLH